MWEKWCLLNTEICLFFHRDNLPPNKKAVKSFLDDKSDVQAVRGRYDPYGVSIDIIEEDGMNNEYDDEYDDTYDDNEIGADDADSADELTTRRWGMLYWSFMMIECAGSSKFGVL